MDATSAPPRSRPRNRRAEIARHAGELFSVRGFHAVRMDDIAEASGITARALYRHYANKQALLSHVVLEDQQHVVDTITALVAQPPEQRDLDATLTTLTEAALDSRRLSLLWQREARHLGSDDFQLVRDRTLWIARQLGELLLVPTRGDLARDVTDIRSWVIVSIISGAGFYDSPLPRHRLAGAGRGEQAGDHRPRCARRGPPCGRVRPHADLPSRAARLRGGTGVPGQGLRRREHRRHRRQGRHRRPRPLPLLRHQGRDPGRRRHPVARVAGTGDDPGPAPPGGDDDVLRLLVEGYVRVALEATDLLAVWLNERLYLPDATRERLDRIQADSLAEWQRWLSAARPRLPDADAATLVTTAKTIIDDCARIPHFRPYPTVAGELAGAALTALGLPVGHGDTGT